MSKILKTMWSKSDKKPKRPSETNISTRIQQESNSKPFDIDLKTIWKYDHEDLCEFIGKYEQFINDLTKKYHDMSEEYPILKEKITLEDIERKRLTEELLQYKQQNQNLKAPVEQKTITRPVLQKSLSNCRLRVPETAQKNTNMKNQTPELDNVLKRSINAKKILELPAVMQLRGAFESVLELNQGLFDGFDAMQKIGGQNNTEGSAKNESEFDEYYIVQGQVRVNAMKGVQSILDFMHKCSEGLEGFLQNIQEIQNQIVNEVNSNLESLIKSLSSTNTRSQELAILAERDANGIRIQSETGSENNIKVIEADNKKQRENLKKDFELKLLELRTQTSEQGKIIEDLINQNHFLGSRNAELDNQLAALELSSGDLRQKLERAEKDLELSKNLSESLRGMMTNSTAEGESKAQIECFNKLMNVFEASKACLNEEIKGLTQELQRKENQSQLEISNLKSSADSMKEEVVQLQKALSTKDAKVLDLENKVIKERLKMDQIKRELSKAEENFKDAKMHLNEQISKNHDLLKKLEDRDNEFIETSRKYREIKKNYKKADLQLIKIQNQLQDEQAQRTKLEQLLLDQKTDSTRLNDTDGSQKSGEDEFTMQGLSTEVRSLRDRVDIITCEANALKEENKTLNKLLTEERRSLEQVKEKREAGIQEIKRLNTIIEKKNSNKLSSKSSQRASESESGHIQVLSTVKKTLETLYKQFIISIQYEKTCNSDFLASAKSMRSIAQGFIPSDNVVRLEKNLNDAILFVREYLENFQ